MHSIDPTPIRKSVSNISRLKEDKKFNHLSQYGSYPTDTDEKKMSLFR
jgi:hypothetical protein